MTASAENVVQCLCILDWPPETEEYADLFQEAVEEGSNPEEGRP